MTTFAMLPNDMVLNCLARVSRLYYPTLSIVSKRFRSLLASVELYQTRELLSRTESCLYVCLQLPTYYGRPHWFTLCRRPNSSKKVLVPITSPNSPSTYQSYFARVGYKIYTTGGSINSDDESTSVMVMDCRSHTWSHAPSMLDSRVKPSVCVLDGKGDLALAQGRICSSHYCVIENVLYSYVSGRIRWYDFQLKCWKEVEGLENLVRFRRNATKLADYGGKLAVLWDDNACGQSAIITRTLNECQPDTNIFCAEIALEKRQGGTIWGTVECLDVVYTTNEPYVVGHVVAATL